MVSAAPGVQTFSVPAVSAAGVAGRGNLRWSVAPAANYPAGALPPGVTVNTATGVVSVDTTSCAAAGACPDLDLILIVSDGPARAAVDLTVAFLPPGAAAPALALVAPPAPHPLAGAASSALGGLPPVTGYPGIALALTFRSDSAAAVGFQYSALPPGAQPLPPQWLSQTVTWVPGTAGAGAGAADEQYLCGAAVLLSGGGGGGGGRRPRSAPLCFDVRLAQDSPPAFDLPQAQAFDIVLNQPFQAPPPTKAPPPPPPALLRPARAPRLAGCSGDGGGGGGGVLPSPRCP